MDILSVEVAFFWAFIWNDKLNIKTKVTIFFMFCNVDCFMNFI